MINLQDILSIDSKYVSLINCIKNKQNCSCFGLNFNEISFGDESSYLWKILNKSFQLDKKMNELKIKKEIDGLKARRENEKKAIEAEEMRLAAMS